MKIVYIWDHPEIYCKFSVVKFGFLLGIASIFMSNKKYKSIMDTYFSNLNKDKTVIDAVLNLETKRGKLRAFVYYNGKKHLQPKYVLEEILQTIEDYECSNLKDIKVKALLFNVTQDVLYLGIRTEDLVWR